MASDLNGSIFFQNAIYNFISNTSQRYTVQVDRPNMNTERND